MPNSGSQQFCARVLRRAALTLISAVLLTGGLAQAQQFSDLISFVGTDGNGPAGTLLLDAAGNIYGTTYYGGSNNCGYGCGTVFKLTRHGSQWTVADLYQFRGGTDGRHPYGGLTFGPDGALYGATFEGGAGPCLIDGPTGCGTVYKLTPPATFCRSISCYWTKTTIYYFTGGIDGSGPQGQLVFDHAGNLYGTTWYGGISVTDGYGVVYELSPSNGAWTSTTLHAFTDGSDGGLPIDGVLMDGSGNLFGTTAFGGSYQGVVYELTNGQSGWTETIVHDFAGGSDGYAPGGLSFDSSGNLFGFTGEGGGQQAGTAFELQPSGGGFIYSIFYNFVPTNGGDPSTIGALTPDNHGNFYSTTVGGIGNSGTIFKLSQAGGSWNVTVLHQFDTYDGYEPGTTPVFDAQGNLYGTTEYGGGGSDGVVWELTP